MTKQCQECQKTFKITESDIKFYNGIEVPEPLNCPDCRRQRRLSWRNERTLYSRKCDMCKRSIVSVYSEDKPFPVYCEKCWYGDKWDPTDYGKDFDFSRPFFEQFRELVDVTPRLYMQNKQCENSEYCNYAYKNKNCYLVFGSHYEENCLYGHYSSKNKECLDYYGCYKSELCYQSIESSNCYNCVYIDHCESCAETYFCIDLKGCKNCLFSVNLRNKQYYIFNKQYTKEDYEKKLKDLELHTRAGLQKVLDIFENQVRKKYPFRYAYMLNCENCEGDDHVNCKDMVYSFNGTNSEQCTYGYKIDETYNSIDTDCMGYDRAEVCYEVIGGSGDFNCRFLDSCWHDTDLTYCNLCFSSKNCFGSVGLVRKEYCILNKKYNKKDYQNLEKKIIDHMKKTGEWGYFFPTEISPYAYNETVAQLNFPLNKEAIKGRGYKWHEQTVAKSSAVAGELPDDINEVSDNFIQQPLKCIDCYKNFKIDKHELKLLKQLQLPLSDKCPQCRHVERFNKINPDKLWTRQCMCTQTEHDHEGRCRKEFETTYHPDRMEIIYCEDCYFKETD